MSFPPPLEMEFKIYLYSDINIKVDHINSNYVTHVVLVLQIKVHVQLTEIPWTKNTTPKQLFFTVLYFYEGEFVNYCILSTAGWVCIKQYLVPYIYVYMCIGHDFNSLVVRNWSHHQLQVMRFLEFSSWVEESSPGQTDAPLKIQHGCIWSDG